MSEYPAGLHFRWWKKGGKVNCENIKGIADVERGYTVQIKRKGEGSEGKGDFKSYYF